MSEPTITQPAWVLALCWIVFAGQAFLIIHFAERFLFGRKDAAFVPTDDRIVGALAVVTGIVGLWHFSRGAPLLGLVLLAALCTTLDFACCADLRAKRVPAAIVFPALLVFGGYDVVTHDVLGFIAGIAIMAPFAFAALASKGTSAGWGDVGLVGLGGFALGLQLGIIAMAIACFAAAGIGLARRKRGLAIAFAPYLAVAIQGALFLPTIR